MQFGAIPRTIGVLLLGACAALPVIAHDEPATYNRVHLSASTEAVVENDILEGVLYYQREGDDPSALAAEVNQSIEWAVAETKKFPTIELRTMDYRTIPVYRNQTLAGWRVRQSLGLKSTDAPLLGGLIGKLQRKLSVQSITYRLSQNRRRDIENKLIVEAIDAFKQRAELVTKRLGHQKHRLVSLNINAGGNIPRPVMLRSSEALLSQAAVPSPTLEPGSSTVQVRADGVIELQVD